MGRIAKPKGMNREKRGPADRRDLLHSRRAEDRRREGRRQGDRRLGSRRTDYCPTCGGELTPTSFCPSCKVRVVKIRLSPRP